MLTNEILDYKTDPDIKFIKIFEKYYCELDDSTSPD